MEQGSPELVRRLKEVLGNRSATREEFQRVAELIEEEGIRKQAELEAYKLMEQAISELNSLTDVKRPEYVYVLKELATFIVTREK